MTAQGTVNGQDNDARVYVPAMVVFKKFSSSRVKGHPVRIVYIKASDPTVIQSVTDEVTQFIADRHKVDPASPDFGVRTQQDIINVAPRPQPRRPFVRCWLGWPQFPSWSVASAL